MLRTIALVSLLLALPGCTAHDRGAAPGPSASHYGSAGQGGAYRIDADSTRAPHAGQWAVAVVGTPFYLAFKTVACGASLALAAPTAAAQALSNSPYVMDAGELGDGLAANCGPPYLLSPS